MMHKVMTTVIFLILNRNATEEYAPIDETFNPIIHRVNNAVKMRAAHPDKPVPETPATLLKYASPPDDLIVKIQSRIDTLIRVAEVKKGKFCFTFGWLMFWNQALSLVQCHRKPRAGEIVRLSSQYLA